MVHPTHAYVWVGLDALGLPSRGIIQAKSTTVAKVMLHQKGILAKKIHKKRRFPFFQRTQNIHRERITQFCRQLATLLSAHLPLTQALETLRSNEVNPSFQCIIETLKQDIQAGLSLANALRKHPHLFHTLMCHIVEAGEQSGTLALLLIKLARFQDQVATIQKKIKAALTYPLLILCLTTIIASGLLIIIVPQFQVLYQNFNAELPLFTRMIIWMSFFLKTKGLLIFCALIASYYGLQHLYKHSTHMAHHVDRRILTLPWIGPIINHAIVARVTHTLSITLSAGLPLLDALKTVADISGNRAYQLAINQAHAHVAQGVSLHAALEQSQQFPHMVVQMIAIGEESSQLESMLAHIATQYGDTLNDAADTISRLLEPFLMLTLGLLIGLLIIAMYLPIFQLGAII